MTYYCTLDGKAFETKEGLQYLFAAATDEEDTNVVRYWDWVVCKGECADRVRAESTLVAEDRPWGR